MEVGNTSVFLKTVLRTIARIDSTEFIQALSQNKPLIVIFNHINFLEVPILIAFSYPLPVTGIVKSETWKNPFFAFLLNTYSGIPINRRGAFSEAFKLAREKIEKGFHVCVAPEGTRSLSGVLQQGKAGVVALSLETDVPILPVAHFGGENIWKNMRRLRRTPFCLKAGRPFRIKFNGMPRREEREEIMSEVMGQVARLLPVQMRGFYTQQAERECKYLEFI